jgi:hypothetical protein
LQITYAANLDIGDAVLNITNAGTSGGNICVNVYTFSPDEQLISCCSCMVTPNALVSLSARSDLTSNTLTPSVPTSIVVNLLASLPIGGVCNPQFPVETVNLAFGAIEWTYTKQKPDGTAGGKITAGITETPAVPAGVSSMQLARLTSFCGFIQANGSGFGICKSCRLGGQGAVAQ